MEFGSSAGNILCFKARAVRREGRNIKDFFCVLEGRLLWRVSTEQLSNPTEYNVWYRLDGYILVRKGIIELERKNVKKKNNK